MEVVAVGASRVVQVLPSRVGEPPVGWGLSQRPEPGVVVVLLVAV